MMQRTINKPSSQRRGIYDVFSYKIKNVVRHRVVVDIQKRKQSQHIP